MTECKNLDTCLERVSEFTYRKACMGNLSSIYCPRRLPPRMTPSEWKILKEMKE